ncbi:hypothetical protein N7510_003391 [Penicillium lagena]|uniref:uncharacterized protein n=1 Tax=Penicillium lagena TaxID=94218 RepID=UPI002541914F|nr:uncharacterized protein N7510_003391 [Penicillium lagena]KAJ5619407.1 hypothetical protein N7510_003391 [Penicillium lagena]
MAPRRSGRPTDASVMTPLSDDSVDDNLHQSKPQISTELLQQLREQITSELRAQLLGDKPNTPRNSDLNEERERIRKLAKERLATKPIQLHGRDDYIKWRESILSDAYMIDATYILEENQESSPFVDAIDTTRWDKQNEVLYTRLLQSMSPHIKANINWGDTTSAAALWSQINIVYGISLAEERLMTVKALLDLNPQGDYVSMIFDYQRIISRLGKMDMSFDDFCHDYLICLLGQWQQHFVRTKLDELYACGRGPIQNLDIKTFINQLVARAQQSTKGQYLPQNPQEFKLEDKYRTSPPKTTRSDQKPKSGSQPQQHSEPKKQKKLCEHCELIVRNPQANAVRALPVTPQWILDTAASKHMTSRKDLFIQLDDPKPSPSDQFDDAGGRVHTVAGYGTIQINIDDIKLTVPDVRYIPTIASDLLSFRQLDQQGFQISLSNDSPKHFRFQSPDGTRFDALPHIDNQTYYLAKPQTHQLIAKVTTRGEARTRSNLTITTSPQEPDPKALTMTEWHQRLSHLNPRDILKLAKASIIKIKGRKTLPFCDVCRQAKQTRRINKTTAYRATKPLSRVHIDIAGGGRTLACDDDQVPPGTKGIRYFALITDDATRYRWIYFLRNRSEAVAAFAQWLEHMKNQGFGAPAFVRSDREFVTENVRQLCLKYGINWEPTPAESPWEDGVSERSNRTIYEKARTMLFDSGLPKFLWKEALDSAIYMMNRLPTRIPLYNDPTPGGTTANHAIQQSVYTTPYTAWTNSPSDISYIRKFGSIAWIHLHGPDKPKGKVDARAKKTRLVGHTSPTIVRVWDPEKNTVKTVNDAVIDEHFEPPTSINQEDSPTTPPTVESDDQPLTDGELISIIQLQNHSKQLPKAPNQPNGVLQCKQKSTF